MNRIKIDIIQFGESKHVDEWSFINRLKRQKKSSLFEILNIKKIALPQSDFWGYADSSLLQLAETSDGANYTLCFIDYPLEGNFFIRRLSPTIGVATFFQTKNIFKEANVELKNFILLQIYKIVILSKLQVGNDMDAIRTHFHDETRSCLFDMCGLKEDIIMSATNPKICFDCEAKLRRTLLSTEFIDVLKSELRQIKKPLYFRITDWIKKHPVFALIITGFFALALNLLASVIFDFIRG